MNIHPIPRASCFLCIILFAAITNPGWADPKMRGPLPDGQKEIIRYMAQHHNELERKVELTETGYTATTTTENKELVTRLHDHFKYMEKRLGTGAMVRKWDPAFAELVEFHDQIMTEVDFLENGIRVAVNGKNEKATKVAQNHAKIVTGFIERGSEAVHSRHDPVFK